MSPATQISAANIRMRRPHTQAKRWPAPSHLAALFAAMTLLAATPAKADWFNICRGLNLGGFAMRPMIVPKGTLFRDNGRADDPLADFSGDKWQLRLETLYAAEIPQISQCVRVLVRITSDSTTKFVSVNDGRRFIYAGAADLLDPIPPSEELLSATGRVVDSVP